MPCPIPFYAFIIIIIICMPIQFVAYASDHDKQHFTSCAPFKCGNISEISYPFRLLGGSDYCGHPRFEVECAQSFGPYADLIMTMESVRYKVNSIAWENQSLNIARMDFLYVDLCPKSGVITDTILDHSLFDFTPGSENATLYYDCEETWIKDPYRFFCDIKNVTRDGYLFFHKPESHHKLLNLSKNCSHNITVPLLERPVPRPSRPDLMRDSIFAALSEGFEVTWKVGMGQCRSCNISGGRCGHDTTTGKFSCFCPKGVHPKECPGFFVNDLVFEKELQSYLDNCSVNIKVLVFEGVLKYHTSKNLDLQQALKEGFDIKYNIDGVYSACSSSGRYCGTNIGSANFACYCQDKPYLYQCHQHGSKVPQKTIIGIGVGFGGLVLVIAAFFFFYQRRNRRKYVPTSYKTRRFSSYYLFRIDYEKDGCYGVPIFNYEELREATDDFDQTNKVGDGGFGTIYKGKLRDGQVVAIKHLNENNYKRKDQFLNEVEILARLQHPNLVILYGCTSPYSQRLLLVYEFISNGTVADHLHGNRAKPGSLSWFTRLNIAIETATALMYLHHSDVVHRDVKTNNILLNDNFSVKVADFGLSRLFPFNVTHISTAPQGTPGYVDPEYHQCYQLTEKSDVYSFGVVLMELISSLHAVDVKRHRHEINLSTMAINKIQCGELHEFVDKHLGFDCNDNIQRMITAVAELAFRCLQHIKEMRPCMDEVLETLKSIQKLDKPPNEVAEMDSLPDDAVLLKSKLIRSPYLVMVKLDSTLTTPNASG